ncbi:MAG: sigma-70 family RNA polymerase sigma factor [Planctomycetota bacterium]
MVPPPSPFQIDALLEHGAFLRRLAGRLVRTEAEADDVVQDAWRIALERRGPAPSKPRAWLAGIVRNRAQRTARDAARRRTRHERAARPEAQDATVDVAARLEVQRRIAEAVASLEEPGRTVIVLRYLDDEKPARIAERLGVPVRTVESRLRRAHEALRERLDAIAGSRSAWCLPLAAWLGVGAIRDAAAAASTTTAAGALAPVATTGGVLMASSIGWVAAGLVGGLAGGWFLREATRPAPEPVLESHEDAPVEDPMTGTGPTLGRDVPALEAATRRADVAEAKAKRLASRVEELVAKVQALEAGGAGTDAAGSEHEGLVIPVGPKQEVLAAIDWKDAGTAAHEMAPMLAPLIRSMAEDKVDQAQAMELGKRNIRLVNAAIKLVEAGLSGTGVNGAFTHPSVTANFIVGTLEAAGVPLDEDQIERLKDVADDYVSREAARVASYGPDTLAFVKLVDESKLKQAFQDAVDAFLTPEQLKVLHPNGPRARLGLDLFSPGIIWQGQVSPITYLRGPSGEETALTVIRTHLKIEPEDAERLRPAVARWIAALPRSIEAIPAAPEDKLGLVTWDRLEACWAPMKGLYEDLIGTLPPDHPAIKVLRESTRCLVPIAPYE